jgi:molybdopterin biosynthesis enzyme
VATGTAVAAGAVEVAGWATADAAAALAAILETDCDAVDVIVAAGAVSDPEPLAFPVLLRCVVD